MPEPEVLVPPSGEDAMLVAVQAALANRPGVLATARLLSHFGEHAQGWVALAALGALARPKNRRAFVLAGAGAVAAHAVAIAVKFVIGRPRPNHPAIAVNVKTPSQLSFPSAHTTSSTAAAVLLGQASGLPLPAVIVPPMVLSRLVLGVHYPSDVATGVVVGAAVAKAVSWIGRRTEESGS